MRSNVRKLISFAIAQAYVDQLRKWDEAEKLRFWVGDGEFYKGMNKAPDSERIVEYAEMVAVSKAYGQFLSGIRTADN